MNSLNLLERANAFSIIPNAQINDASNSTISKLLNLELLDTSKFSLRLWDVIAIVFIILLTTLTLRVVKETLS